MFDVNKILEKIKAALKWAAAQPVMISTVISDRDKLKMGIVLLLGFWSFSVTYTSFHFMIPSSPQALNFKVHRIKRRPSEIHDSNLNFFCLFFSH